MASTFFGLNIGYTGLISANAALNTTGNNISNVETEGYSRQQTVQQAAKAIRTNTTYGMAGAGVDTVAIEQVRNSYYDLKYWQNNSELGQFSIKKQYSTEIEAYFTDTDDVQGFNVIFGDMFDALEEVFKSSGDDTRKIEFLSQCSALTEYFNSMATNLEKLQKDANDEMANKVSEINTLAAEIATLDKQINTIEITGTKANELRDKRNLLIDQLSQIVDVEVQEIPVYTSEGGDEESGIYRYIVNIGGGQNLVNGYEYSTINCVARDYKANQSDADGLYDLVWSNGVEFNLYGNNIGGSLQGLIEVRDGNNEEYFHGKVLSTGTKVLPNEGGRTANTVTLEATYEYMQDLNKLTISESGQVQVGNKLYDYTGWDYSYDAVNDKYYYTLYLADGQNAAGHETEDIKIGDSINYQGIPYYQSQLNEWCRSFAEAINKVELGAQDEYGNQAQEIFQATNIVDNNNNYDFAEYNYNLTSSTQTSTTSRSNNYQKLTAKNFTVSNEMSKDVNLFGTTDDITKGQDAQDITQKLLQVQTDKNMMNFRGCTAGEFLQCITTDTALNASNANTFYANYDKISSAIINQRLSVMGVDNDEEALNLVKFQEAYNLASKMIQVMTEIYDQLILRTGV